MIRVDSTRLVRISDIGKVLPSVSVRAGKRCGDIVVDGAQSIVHVRSAQLKNSIHIIENTPEHTLVGATADHAGHEEFSNGHAFWMPQLHKMENGLAISIYFEELDKAA